MTSKAKNLEKTQGPHYYIFLENDKFPVWMEIGSGGFLKIPLSWLKPGTSAFDRTFTFSFDNMYIGQHTDYMLYLKGVSINTVINSDGTFMMELDISPIVKPSARIKARKNKYGTTEFLKRIMLSYEIMCPIWQ